MMSVRAAFVLGSLLQQILIARIVDPSVFGLMSYCLLTMTLLLVFSETGIVGSIIIADSVGEAELNFAWTVQVLRGVILAVVLYTAAPYVGRFFAEPDLRELLRVIALAPAIEGFASPRLLLLRRELSFGKLSAIQLADVVVRIGLSIPLAIAWGNAWSLVIPYVAAGAVKTLLSYLLAPQLPRFRLDRAMAHRFSRFGRWAFLNSILNYTINQGDNIVVGRVLNSTSLGLYSMAYRIGNMPFTELGAVISEVGFPALRKASDSIRVSFVNLYAVTCALVFPMAIGLMSVGDLVIGMVLGDQWMPMLRAFQILTLWGAVRAMTVVTGPLFNALARPDLQTFTATTRAIVLLASVVPATLLWGINGTASAVLVSSLVEGPVALAVAYRHLKFDPRALVLSTVVPLLGSGLMAISVHVLRVGLAPVPSHTALISSIAVGVVVYAFVSWEARRRVGYAGLDIVIRGVQDSIPRRRNV